MSEEAEPLQEAEVDVRQLVIDELSQAMERLAMDIPRVEAALILRLGIGFFADSHARSFGHAATVKALIETARRGIHCSAEELTATRN